VEESDIIPIEPMDDTGAQMLLEKKLGDGVDKKNTAELSKVLEFMPLALVQAAAFIRQRAPRCSVQQYLDQFNKSDRKKTSLLDYNGGHLRRDAEAKNSIIITWQISFDYILETRRTAADLLSLMSFFDRQGIPEELLQTRVGMGNEYRDEEHLLTDGENSDDDSESESSAVGFEDDILTLRNYSFITLTNNATTFDMHRLVQLATRKWLEDQGQLEVWKQRYIDILYAAFPTAEYENWAKCHTLFPHAKSALLHRPESENSLRQWAQLLYNAAWYASNKESLSDAEKLSAVSLKVRKNLLGEEHVNTLESIEMMVGIRYITGQWKEAEETLMRLLETRSRVLGKEHPHTLNSMSNLASAYTSNQGRWKEAEELFLQAIEINSRVIGEEHPHTLNSMTNLAALYRNQGRCKEAEELLLHVIEMRLRVVGEEHPETLNSITNLASTYWLQGRWEEAEELSVQVIKTGSRVVGKEHKDTLNSMSNLASTYMGQGRWKEAEELFLQVIETNSRLIGEEHPYTLVDMSNLATAYRGQGRLKEAEELEAQVMETSLRVLGEEHPDTLTSMSNLAITLNSQNRQEEAILLMEKCVLRRERTIGPSCPDTESSREILKRWKIKSLESE
jgi:tetratricopeptide (TPR) repeat protein